MGSAAYRYGFGNLLAITDQLSVNVKFVYMDFNELRYGAGNLQSYYDPNTSMLSLGVRYTFNFGGDAQGQFSSFSSQNF